MLYLFGGDCIRYITCSRCGIVSEGHKCPYKTYKAKDKKIDKFRKTIQWTRKSIEIRQRDLYLCRVCLADKHNTISQLNYGKLEVHHIVPLNEDYSRRLDNGNLITLCNYHHKMAERGEITRQELYELIPPRVSEK